MIERTDSGDTGAPSASNSIAVPLPGNRSQGDTPSRQTNGPALVMTAPDGIDPETFEIRTAKWPRRARVAFIAGAAVALWVVIARSFG